MRKHRVSVFGQGGRGTLRYSILVGGGGAAFLRCFWMIANQSQRLVGSVCPFLEAS